MNSEQQLTKFYCIRHNNTQVDDKKVRILYITIPNTKYVTHMQKIKAFLHLNVTL